MKRNDEVTAHTLFRDQHLLRAVVISLPRHWHNCVQGTNEVRWRPGKEASLSPPCSKTEVFRKQMYCNEESICGIVRTFWWLRSHSAPPTAPIVTRRPGNCAPLGAPSLRPWLRDQEYSDLTASNTRLSTLYSRNSPNTFSRRTPSYAFLRSAKQF